MLRLATTAVPDESGIAELRLEDVGAELFELLPIARWRELGSHSILQLSSSWRSIRQGLDYSQSHLGESREIHAARPQQSGGAPIIKEKIILLRRGPAFDLKAADVLWTLMDVVNGTERRWSVVGFRRVADVG